MPPRAAPRTRSCGASDLRLAEATCRCPACGTPRTKAKDPETSRSPSRSPRRTRRHRHRPRRRPRLGPRRRVPASLGRPSSSTRRRRRMRPRRRIRRRRARGRRAPRAPASSWRKARDAFERTRPRISMLGVSRAQTRDTTHSETSPPPRPGRRHRCHPRMPRARANDHAGRDWAFSESREPREESRTCRLPTNFGETNAICRSRKTRRVLSNFPSVDRRLPFFHRSGGR